MRVLSLDADESSLAFGLHEVVPEGVTTLFERVVGMAKNRGLQVAPLTGSSGAGSVKEAILSAVKLAFGHGRLDAVGCRVRLRVQQPEFAQESRPMELDLRLAMAPSLQAMEYAMELLPGVPVVAVFEADMVAADQDESRLDESSRIAAATYRSACRAER